MFCVVCFCLFVVCVLCVVCCVFLCCCVLCCCCVVVVVCCVLCCCCCCVCVVGVFRASLPDPPPPDLPPPDLPPPDPPPPDPLRRTAQNFALFFPSPATVFILFSLSCWSFSLNFGGVFEDQDPQMCTFGLSGCRVKPRRPHQTGPPGLAHDSRENSKRARLSAPALQTPPKFHEKDQQEREKRIKTVAGEGKKNAKFWAPTLRGPTLRGPTLRGPHFFWVWPPNPLGLHHDTKNIGQKIGLAKIGLAKICFGQNWPGQNHDGQKWIGQHWIGQNWSNQDGQNGIGQSRSLPRVSGLGFRV